MFVNVHGYAVVHAPLFDTNVSCAGVGSDTSTPGAVDGPLFVTVIEYVTVCPEDADTGPVLEIETSVLGVTARIAAAELFAGFGSVDVVVTVAVFVIDPAAVGATV